MFTRRLNGKYAVIDKEGFFIVALFNSLSEAIEFIKENSMF
jgi:hypothetical protein